MLLRHTSVTPRSLAARRSNALKSTRPRTARGKARVRLNALKDGRHAVLAARAPRLRQRLIEAGHTEEEALYGAIQSRIAQASGIQGPAARREIDRLALLAWCSVWRTRSEKSKLESPDISVGNGFWVLTDCRFSPQRFSIVDPWRRAGLVFWRQRRHRPPGNGSGWRSASTSIGTDSSTTAWRTRSDPQLRPLISRQSVRRRRVRFTRADCAAVFTGWQSLERLNGRATECSPMAVPTLLFSL